MSAFAIDNEVRGTGRRESPEPPVAAARAPEPVRVYRDPRDIRTINRLAGLALVLVTLLTCSLFANGYQHKEKPDRVVVDKDSGRVLLLNDREYGETENVALVPDGVTDKDKE